MCTCMCVYMCGYSTTIFACSTTLSKSERVLEREIQHYVSWKLQIGDALVKRRGDSVNNVLISKRRFLLE